MIDERLAMQPLEIGWFVVAGGVLLLVKTAWEFRHAQKLAHAAARAQEMQDQGRRPQAITLLEELLKHGNRVIPLAALPARAILVTLYQAEGRHADAEAQARTSLELLDAHGDMAKIPDLLALKVELCRRLSDVLESQGRNDEARAALQQADAVALLIRDDTAAVVEQQALQLERDGKHLEAARLFAQVVQNGKKPRGEKARRAQAQLDAQGLCRASCAFYNAGHFTDGLDAGRDALRASALSPENSISILARLQTSNCALALADLDTARQMASEATILARKRGQPDEIAQCLLLTAQVYLMAGSLDAAEQAARNAAASSPAQQSLADACASEADILRGHYAGALARLHAARDRPPNPYAPLQQRLSGILALGQAQALVEMERYDDALIVLAEAEEILLKDERLWRICQAGWLWAKAGRREPDAKEQLRQFARMLEEEAHTWDDVMAQRDLLPILARGLMTTGDFAAALGMWERYQSARPRPVYIPYCNCCRGDCYYALGDTQAAQRSWRSASESGLDTYHTRLARERLVSFMPRAG